jgi:hypothetical protein
MSKVFIIRALGGGELSNTRFLSNAFATYLAENDCDIRLELMCPEDIKIKRWSPTEAIDWVLSGNAHIISTHIHQGAISTVLLCFLSIKINLFAQRCW